MTLPVKMISGKSYHVNQNKSILWLRKCNQLINALSKDVSRLHIDIKVVSKI